LIEIQREHPRAESLRIREKLVKAHKKNILTTAGLIAHGRGEAFDYIIGEKTMPFAAKAEKAAVASLLLAKRPVISVNGNAAALCAAELVKFSKLVNAKLEVNLFHRSIGREKAVEKALRKAGAQHIYGLGEKASSTIPEIMSQRRKVDPEGILIADVVLVPLEDGDRTIALRKMGKTVVTIDLNPFSRTSQFASITIVDNITRAISNMIREAQRLKARNPSEIRKILKTYDNRKIIGEAISHINSRLNKLARKGIFIENE
jgi:4-phosphopantoate--beta-alanine ligase